MSVDNALTLCVLLTKQGDPCGKPGHPDLPAGICVEHALSVYRAVAAMMEAQRGEESRP